MFKSRLASGAFISIFLFPPIFPDNTTFWSKLILPSGALILTSGLFPFIFISGELIAILLFF